MADNTVNVELVIQASQSVQTMGEVKQSLKDIRLAMNDVALGSPEMAQLTEEFRKQREMVKSLRQEYPGLKQIETIGKTTTAAFGAATASMALFAGENEKLNEGLKKTAASLELMLSVKEFARGLREAMIANEGLNASLLTNPYVLIGAAIAAIAVGIYTFASATKDAGEEVKKLNEQSTEKLKLSLEKINEEGAKELEQLKENIKQLEIQKASKDQIAAASITASNQEIEQAQKQRDSVTKADKEQFENLEANRAKQEFNRKQIEREEGKSFAEKAEQLIFFNTTVGMATAGFKEQNIVLDGQIKKGEEIKAIFDKADGTIVKAGNDIKNTLLGTGEDKLEKQLENAKTLYDKITASVEHQLEIKKIGGATEIELNKQEQENAKNNINLLEYEINQFKTKYGLNEAQKKQLADYINLLDNQKNKQEILIAQGEKLAADAATKAEQARLDKLNKAYQDMVKNEQFFTELKKAQGGTVTQIEQMNLANIQNQINGTKELIAQTQLSTDADEDNKKRLEVLRQQLKDLTDQQTLLNAATDHYNKTHLFTPEQEGEIKEADKMVKEVQKAITAFGQLATQTAQQQADARIAIYQKENDREQQGLSERLQLGLVTQQQYDQQKKKMDDKLAAEKAEASKKAFDIQKGVNIAQAVINTALGITNALATAPSIIVGVIMAALVGATGAAQIALIASQKSPAFATGGIFSDGGSVNGVGTGTSDSVNARLSNGESVINAKSTSAFAPLLSAINQVGGGIAFRGHPPITHTPSSAGQNNNSTPAPQSPQKVYVTEYDITRVQKKVAAIQNRSTF